jgi:hypothetical protein
VRWANVSSSTETVQYSAREAQRGVTGTARRESRECAQTYYVPSLLAAYPATPPLGAQALGAHVHGDDQIEKVRLVFDEELNESDASKTVISAAENDSAVDCGRRPRKGMLLNVSQRRQVAQTQTSSFALSGVDLFEASLIDVRCGVH